MQGTSFLKTIKSYVIIAVLFFLIFSCKRKEITYQKLQGNVFGTTFHITYASNTNQIVSQSIDSLFKKINNSLSTYQSNSDITKLNNGLLKTEVDTHFIAVFQLAKEVFQQTEGYFDPTIGKMVNAWGFGPQKISETPTQKEVDSLMRYVGFEKVQLQNHSILKTDAAIYLDFNAIAKGYGVDAVGNFLESKGITNYLVEIGGEIRARGKNTKGKRWSVGIEEPNFDGTRSLQKVTLLSNESIATSGNYRKFRVDAVTGKKIAHTLNPKTGFSAKTDLLSVSVIAAEDCALVDAYATAFMAMGLEKAKKIAKQHPELKVFFIYLENNEMKTFASEGLEFAK